MDGRPTTNGTEGAYQGAAVGERDLALRTMGGRPTTMGTEGTGSALWALFGPMRRMPKAGEMFQKRAKCFKSDFGGDLRRLAENKKRAEKRKGATTY